MGLAIPPHVMLPHDVRKHSATNMFKFEIFFLFVFFLMWVGSEEEELTVVSCG